MATFESDLGKVTAYAYAVDAGYQGTEAEFEEDLLNAVSTFKTDKTLAVEDKAADAKTTGNKIAELKNEIDDIVDITGRTFDLTWISGYTINANPATGSFSIEPYTGRRYAEPFKSTNDFTVVPNINNVGVIATDANGNSTYTSGWFSDKKTIDASVGTYFYILCRIIYYK